MKFPNNSLKETVGSARIMNLASRAMSTFTGDIFIMDGRSCLNMETLLMFWQFLVNYKMLHLPANNSRKIVFIYFWSSDAFIIYH